MLLFAPLARLAHYALLLRLALLLIAAEHKGYMVNNFLYHYNDFRIMLFLALGFFEPKALFALCSASLKAKALFALRSASF